MGTAKPRTEWMGAVPRFTPDAPPRDWVKQHNMPRGIGTKAFATNGARPVPRRANCHFYGIDSDTRNVYFY